MQVTAPLLLMFSLSTLAAPPLSDSLGQGLPAYTLCGLNTLAELDTSRLQAANSAKWAVSIVSENLDGFKPRSFVCASADRWERGEAVYPFRLTELPDSPTFEYYGVTICGVKARGNWVSTADGKYFRFVSRSGKAVKAFRATPQGNGLCLSGDRLPLRDNRFFVDLVQQIRKPYGGLFAPFKPNGSDRKAPGRSSGAILKN